MHQPIDLNALEDFLKENVPAIKLPIKLKQFGYGQSNPTYLVSSANGDRFVLRKKPPGKLVSKTAHNVKREYLVLHALETTDVPVPRTIHLSEDDNTIGTTFYIMSFLDGRIFEDPSLPGVSAADRTQMWKDAVTTLGKLHRIDYAAIGLANYGKPGRFYQRQLRTFRTITTAQAEVKSKKTGESVGAVPGINEMIEYFDEPATQPSDRRTLIHGDYKMDNLVFHKTKPRVIGILDWEMSTIGHPLSDIVNLTTPWILGSTGLGVPPRCEFAAGNQPPGLPSLDQCLIWYNESAAWDARPHILWGFAFGLFRASIVNQGIKARYALEQTGSPEAKAWALQVAPYADLAMSHIKEIKAQTARSVASKL